MKYMFFSSPWIKNLSKNLLIFYFSANLINLFLVLINTFGKTILYEDSFLLLKPNNINFLNWALKPHNGHIIFISKIFSSLFTRLSLSPSGYNISISILILLSGLIIIYKIINLNYKNGKHSQIIFLSIAFFWISPWQWENIIWEFQIPWFLISFLVLLLTLSNLYDYENISKRKFLINNLFLTCSPLIAILSSGQGICYLNCVFISLIAKKKKLFLPWLGLFFSYLIYFTIRLNSSQHLSISLNIFRNLIYFFAGICTIFKPSISSFNNFSNQNWVIPILSSFFILVILVKNSFFTIINFIKLDFRNIKIFIPLLFGLQFFILASLTRSEYGFYQGAVSRYHTCLVLIPIGLILIMTNNQLYLDKICNYKIIEDKISKFSIIFVIIVLINSSSLFQTIFETQIVFKTRLENFNVFKDTCTISNLPNKNFLIKNNFKKLREYHGVNFPPEEKANKIEVFQNYINSDLCSKVNFYFQ